MIQWRKSEDLVLGVQKEPQNAQFLQPFLILCQRQNSGWIDLHFALV